ncbi:GntR family transcriptional regulator [Roseivivax marinus]|jgi:DNA-binding GntR family transcriptional regulator|uniref:GntR family transcriptional regulator n=2 Tax=Roseivivax marinus TaxID=1379903 RepID=W4HNF9_9RHOB|nr:GntR family transcriptional regulator [Roseivivax marinus]ETW13656.1 GntR family transcriptional regulator [Roseivivax marinus]UMA65231.1 GntR family transcriptional regulator [Roseivivax marinus]
MLSSSRSSPIFGPRAAEPAPSAHDRVYRGLRSRIMFGQIPPGAPLTLRGIGREFDVSMTPAREAVQRLVAEGALSMSASGRVSTPELSNDRIEELAALRALLEVELASRAIPRAHMALIDRLQTINTGISEIVANRDAAGYIRANLEFHRTLYLRAQAPAMLAMAETVWLQLGPTMRALYTRLRRSEAPHYHRLIIAALKAGDEPGLRLAVRSDVTQGLKMLVG